MGGGLLRALSRKRSTVQWCGRVGTVPPNGKVDETTTILKYVEWFSFQLCCTLWKTLHRRQLLRAVTLLLPGLFHRTSQCRDGWVKLILGELGDGLTELGIGHKLRRKSVCLFM